MKRLWPVSLIFLFCIAGCGTLSRRDLKLQALRNQISTLEVQLQAKDAQINTLMEQSQQLSEADLSPRESALFAVPASGAVVETKSRPNIRQIQTALRNAGYNPGSLDGKMGRQTREAIRAFQKDNGLSADGKAGKQTWKLLGRYLNKKIK